MADQHEADGGAVDLKVLSPSSEVTADLYFPQLQLTTTVAELKLRIKEQIPSHPDTSRMRLILRGRVMANGDTTLKAIFASSNVRIGAETETIHLVIRELHGSTSEPSLAPRAQPSPPRQRTQQLPQPPQNLHHGRSVPNLHTPAGLQPPMPPQAANAGAAPHAFQQPTGNPAANHGIPIPDNLRAIMELEHEHRTRVMAHQARHFDSMRAGLMNAANNPLGPGTRTPSPGAAAFHNPNMTAFQANQALPIPDDNQAREEAERTRLARHPGLEQQLRYINQVHQQMQQRSSSQPPLRNPASAPPSSTTPPSGVPQTGSTTHTSIPNAPVASDSVPDPTRRTSGSDSSSGGREIPALQNLTNRLEHTEREINTLRDLLSNINAGSSNGFPAGSLPMQRLAALQQYEALRNHTRTLVVILDQISNILRNLTVPEAATRTPHTVEQANDLRSSTDRLRNEVRMLENRVNALIFTATANAPAFNQVPRAPSPAGRVGSQLASRMASRAASPAPPLVRAPGLEPSTAASGLAQSYDTPSVFLLNSPQGPQALLMRDDQITNQPSPTFQPNLATPQPELSPQNEEVLRMIEQLQAMMANQGRVPSGAASPRAQNQPAPPHLPNGQADGRGQPNEVQPGLVVRPAAGNPGIFQLIAAAIPHIWFIIRIAFFIYFFSAGLDWRRLIPMSLIGLGVWLIHIGLFDERWEGVRRHFEGLIMDDPNRGPNVPRDAGPQAADPGAGAAGREVRPEDTAARLLAARDADNTGWLRERARTVERAAAMFVASLWPGVGERHLRARDEARQRAEEAAAAATAAANATNDEQANDANAGEGVAGQGSDEDDVSAMFTPASAPANGTSSGSAAATGSHSASVAEGADGLRSRQPRDDDET